MMKTPLWRVGITQKVQNQYADWSRLFYDEHNCHTRQGSDHRQKEGEETTAVKRLEMCLGDRLSLL